jgi:hypothetical protein
MSLKEEGIVLEITEMVTNWHSTRSWIIFIYRHWDAFSFIRNLLPPLWRSFKDAYSSRISAVYVRQVARLVMHDILLVEVCQKAPLFPCFHSFTSPSEILLLSFPSNEKSLCSPDMIEITSLGDYLFLERMPRSKTCQINFTSYFRWRMYVPSSRLKVMKLHPRPRAIALIMLFSVRDIYTAFFWLSGDNWHSSHTMANCNAGKNLLRKLTVEFVIMLRKGCVCQMGVEYSIVYSCDGCSVVDTFIITFGHKKRSVGVWF